MAFFLKRDSSTGSATSGKSPNKPARRITKDDISGPFSLSRGVSQSLPTGSSTLKDAMRGHKRGISEPFPPSHAESKSPIGGRIKPAITKIILTAIPAFPNSPPGQGFPRRMDRARSIQITLPLNVDKPLPVPPTVEPLKLRSKGPQITITQPTPTSPYSVYSQSSNLENISIFEGFMGYRFTPSLYDIPMAENAWDDKSVVRPDSVASNVTWKTCGPGDHHIPRKRSRSLNVSGRPPIDDEYDTIQLAFDEALTLHPPFHRGGGFYTFGVKSEELAFPQDVRQTRASSLLDPDYFAKRMSQHLEDNGVHATVEVVDYKNAESLTDCETLIGHPKGMQKVDPERPIPEELPVNIVIECFRGDQEQYDADLEAREIRFAAGGSSRTSSILDDEIYVFRRNTRQLSVNEQEELRVRRRGTLFRDWADDGEDDDSGGGDSSEGVVLDGDFADEPEEVADVLTLQN